MEKEWTIGRGIGVGLKWIAISIVIVALISLARDIWIDDDYYGGDMPRVKMLESDPELDMVCQDYCYENENNCEWIDVGEDKNENERM